MEVRAVQMRMSRLRVGSPLEEAEASLEASKLVTALLNASCEPSVVLSAICEQ